MKISQHLLAVSVADRDGADARADHTQGRLVQVGRQHVRRGSRRRSRPSSPKATAWCQRRKSRPAAAPVWKAASPSAHQAQVDPRASSCSPISRLAVRIEGGAIEASARMALARATVGQSPLAAARQADGDERRPRGGPERCRSQLPVQALEARRRAPARGRSPLPAPTNGYSRRSARPSQRSAAGEQVHRISEQEVALGHRQDLEPVR